MNAAQSAEQLESSKTSEIDFGSNQAQGVDQNQSQINACQMEIANTKQQASPVASKAKAADEWQYIDMPSSPCEIEEEIESLYKNVPEVANHFTIVEKIGEGAFSSVFLARLKHYPEVSEMFALKHILPTTHPARIENELRCLLKLGGQDNVMGVKLCLRNKDNVVIVMDYFPHDKFQDILSVMSTSEARDYMRNLLIALRQVHQYKVIHRDVKPSNFLYNRERKRYALVDFGLASGHFLIDRDGEKIGRKNESPKSCTAPSSSHATRVPLSPSKANINQSNRVNKFADKWKHPSAYSSNDATIIDPVDKWKHPSANSAKEATIICGSIMLCQSISGEVWFVRLPGEAANLLAVCCKVKLSHSVKYPGPVLNLAAHTIVRRSFVLGPVHNISYIVLMLDVKTNSTKLNSIFSPGKALTLSEVLPALDLRTTCLKLRSSQMTSRTGPCDPGHQPSDLVHEWSSMSQDAFHLLTRMLDPNPSTRITAEQALKHPYFAESKPS
ncbi:hypothetical protein EGW08_008319 [Elysia chlorotica]|uniref:non-specific serine/threonine protein kinase n=1 Tax=Elysia chlorotica TaxID=188477 RepID=A0A433TQN5_ELYCH|nr:hypothetical protein EGW08_008319 [Elysia chlorotica]